MSKFEAHPYIDIFQAEKKSRAEQCQWVVMVRDEDGYFGTMGMAVARFQGPEAEGYAKFHADHLNAIDANQIPSPETEKPICVHCFQDPAHHAEGCPTIPRILKCTRCNIIYVGALLDPCDRCKSTEHLLYYDPEIKSGKMSVQIRPHDPGMPGPVRKPETGNRQPGKNPFPRECLDCGAAEGDMHRPGCEAVARGERQMAELEAQLKDECKAGTAAQASYLASVDPASEYSEGPDEDQPDTED